MRRWLIQPRGGGAHLPTAPWDSPRARSSKTGGRRRLRKSTRSREASPMSDLITIDLLDADCALREAEDQVAGDTRADFFRKAAIGGGVLLGGGVLMSGFPALAAAKPSKAQDIKILNYALTLEYLENAFYVEAL